MSSLPVIAAQRTAAWPLEVVDIAPQMGVAPFFSALSQLYLSFISAFSQLLLTSCTLADCPPEPGVLENQRSAPLNEKGQLPAAGRLGDGGIAAVPSCMCLLLSDPELKGGAFL